jgi:crotonobetainyl-CoA:carnitine CoA-transferase CaiB-like acyl-CoA transferase
MSSNPAGPVSSHLRLEALRVVELTEDKAETCGRLLADLGADVVRVEPPGGARSRRQASTHCGRNVSFAVHNLNKRSVVVDLESQGGRVEMLDLLIGAGATAQLGATRINEEIIKSRCPN